MKMNIAVVYSEPSKVWVTTGRELQVSDDNGYTGILVGGIFNFNISNSDLLYIASQDYNGAFTQNGGKTWKYCNASGHGWGGFTYGAYAASENVLVTMVSPGWHEPGVLTISKNGGNSFAKTNLVCNGLETGCGDARDTSLIAPGNLVLTAEIIQDSNSVEKVEFYKGNELLAKDTTPPFQFDWQNIEPGEYEIYAVATDSSGNTAYSEKIKVQV